jgi:hypothetical protein
MDSTAMLAPAQATAVLRSSGSEAAPCAPDTDDNELHDRTFKWLAMLPAPMRPINTARQYPRIANKLRDLWGHCEYTRLHFQSLLLDRYQGGKGFPPQVRQELVALQKYYFETFSGMSALLWNAVPLNTPTIPDRVFPLPRQEAEIHLWGGPE